MKRFFCAICAAFFLLLPIAASARHFPALSMLQDFILKNSPELISATGPHTVDLSGTILQLTHTGPNNHCDMILQVEDSRAHFVPSWGCPVINVHFRAHVDPLPFSVGDQIDVTGSINSLYSSAMIPYINADAINGSDDY